MVRITQSLLSNRTLFNLQNNMMELSEIQNKLSTGRRISKASDDAVSFTQALDLRSNIRQGRAFMNNIDAARSNLELSETSLGSLTEVLQTIRTKAVQGANDFDEPARIALSQEVAELYGQILDLSNSNFNGQYIFGGSQTQNQAFVSEDGVIKYNGDNFERQVTISKNTKLTSNINGMQAFMHTPNQITASVRVADTGAPLSQQLGLVHPDFPNLPGIPEDVPGAQVDRSPNPQNSPGPQPNNFAFFTIHGTEIRVDLSKDSLEDVQNRINANMDDVVASINSKNQLVITSRRSDALELKDGPKNLGHPADKPQQANLLSALGMHRRIENQRSLTNGFPSMDPLADPNASPLPERNVINLDDDTFLFARSNTGPNDERAVPFADNMALTNIDSDGNEAVTDTDDPEFIDQLEAIRVTIDGETIDIDLRELSRGRDFDGTPGNDDDIPGSRLEDMLDLINNHPQLQGRATAYINADGTGIGISAVESTDQFEVESVRKLFGRDITTRVTIQPVSGDTTVSRFGQIDESTELDELPGALVDSTVGAAGDPVSGSLGIRRPEPPPAGQPPDTNQGLIVITNNGQSDTVDLREAQTIGDVIQAINKSKAGVKAEINESKTGINITTLNGHDNSLSIVDFQDGTVARDLGLYIPPQNRALSSDTGITATNTVAADFPAVANDGEFTLEVRDNAGRTIETYTVPVSVTDTFEDIVARIDEIDGKSGPGNGLISANFSDLNPPNGPTLNIVNNFNGHSIFIDPATDTTGSDNTDRFTQLTGLAGYTFVEETEADALQPYISAQDTSGILGLSGEGQVNEIEEQNVFKSVKELERSLRNNNTEGIQKALEDLDIDLDKVLNTRTILGSRLNRLESTNSRLESGEDFLRQDLSRVEDVDLAQTITDLNLTQNAFNAALQASSRVLQQSLINFLR